MGGDFGRQTKQEVHDQIFLGLHVYYSRAAGVDDAYVYYSRAAGVDDAMVFPRGDGPDRYIRTLADRTKANNLTRLPDCGL